MSPEEQPGEEIKRDGDEDGDGERCMSNIVLGKSRAGDEELDSGRKENEVQDEPPDGGYGWVCVMCCALINMHTWGLNSSYAVFLAYYIDHDIFAGAGRLDYAFIGGLSISQTFIVSPVATYTTKRFGTHTTLIIGVFFETASFIGASFATKIWHLFLTQGICFGWGLGFLFVGNVAIVPQWFTTKRSLANGISAAGAGLGGLTYSLAAEAMITHISLSWAFRILGIVACFVNLVASLLLKDRNKQVGSRQLSFDYNLLKRPEFLGLQAFGFLSMLGYIVLLFSLPNYASQLGLTSQQGSVIGAILNLGQFLGRPFIGYFSDSFGRINMAATMTFLAGLFTLAIWIPAKSYGVLILFALVGGSVAGTFWTIVAPVWTEVLGLRELPSGLNITWLVLAVPTTFSEAIALEIVSSDHGRYLGAQLFAGCMYVGAAVTLWSVRAWKIGELEVEQAKVAETEKSQESVAVVLENARRDEDNVDVPKTGDRSSFMQRVFMWRRV